MHQYFVGCLALCGGLSRSTFRERQQAVSARTTLKRSPFHCWLLSSVCTAGPHPPLRLAGRPSRGHLVEAPPPVTTPNHCKQSNIKPNVPNEIFYDPLGSSMPGPCTIHLSSAHINGNQEEYLATHIHTQNAMIEASENTHRHVLVSARQRQLSTVGVLRNDRKVNRARRPEEKDKTIRHNQHQRKVSNMRVRPIAPTRLATARSMPSNVQTYTSGERERDGPPGVHVIAVRFSRATPYFSVLPGSGLQCTIRATSLPAHSKQ